MLLSPGGWLFSNWELEIKWKISGTFLAPEIFDLCFNCHLSTIAFYVEINYIYRQP